ncbi:DUF3884 family protein [Isobaculum melis]|uniref:DUF3884 domain-containing protein n=1 Tax=Isobaculum melis TaxID=142588 RepID=A0A1H9SDH6_9LACT|nr:DUF3884 family protein [Isobaculum melis]SER82635.1 Protein of unknown function [Isobaculum melis]
MKNIKKAVKKIDKVLLPGIYQVRFENVAPIELNDYPALNELGDWLSHSTKIWGCHSELNKEAFEDKFFEITKLNPKDIEIVRGGKGINVLTPGWKV